MKSTLGMINNRFHYSKKNSKLEDKNNRDYSKLNREKRGGKIYQ